ncbi:MAG: penicillin-binding protein 1C, partial [Alphaproteobacteria bacterium]|nr:penicillin-binding protein 1C [Alphaproteobacteria bacterium]
MIRWILLSLTLALVTLAAATWFSLRPLPSLDSVTAAAPYAQVVAADGTPLNATYANQWNTHNPRPLHQIPPFLQQAFIASEDRRFRKHDGVDWQARGAALISNIRHVRNVRGASTISEQVVKMLQPRPRNLWSRWVEGFEAMRLEEQENKDAILEFYLNQVPYAANRRGVAEAARYYFSRDVDTLSRKEMMALAVLVRAPSRMDLFHSTAPAEAATARLNAYMKADIGDAPLTLENDALQVSAPQFIAAVQRQKTAQSGKIITTLDAPLQAKAQEFLDGRLRELKRQKVRHGAVLIADHTTGAVLVWAVGDNTEDLQQRTQIDAVSAARQPGSALKPFLYATALEKGWTPATVIDDAPLMEMVGAGLHSYQNYSRTFYGPVSLREALGNSLNIPALKALQFVGGDAYLQKLHLAGFNGLKQHPDTYGDGLALGNGEVTLFELVQAYATLANRGRFRPLHIIADDHSPAQERQVFTPNAASLIGNILSDSRARRLEFGAYSVLNLPVQTAVKTGTSSDYRDAWAVGYNYRYVVGAWMGNLDQTPTDGITGSIGPSLILRSLFAELTRNQQTRPLYFSPQLVEHTLCRETHTLKTAADEGCASQSEWFDPAFPPAEPRASTQAVPIRLRRPTPGLHLAYDPRIPADKQF